MFSDTRAYLWYLVLLLSVRRKDIDRWTSKGRRMVIYELEELKQERRGELKRRESIMSDLSIWWPLQSCTGVSWSAEMGCSKEMAYFLLTLERLT